MPGGSKYRRPNSPVFGPTFRTGANNGQNHTQRAGKTDKNQKYKEFLTLRDDAGILQKRNGQNVAHGDQSKDQEDHTEAFGFLPGNQNFLVSEGFHKCFPRQNLTFICHGKPALLHYGDNTSPYWGFPQKFRALELQIYAPMGNV